MKKVLMLATTAAMIEQFNKENIQLLKNMGYEVHVVGNFEKGNPISEEKLEIFKHQLEKNNDFWYHIPSARNPLNIIANYKSYKIVSDLIKKNQYDFIHCHTPIGSVIGRFAAHKNCSKIIYTAHGFHFYKGAPIINWLLYYPVEKFLSKWTEIIITVNHYDYNIAKNNFYAKKTVLIPGVGLRTDLIENYYVNYNFTRKCLKLKNDDFVIVSVGELNKNKNHSVIIRAISKIKDKKIKYIICGRGGYKKKLLNLTNKLGLQGRVLFLGFREDIVDILKIADCFAFPSKREGLGLAALEAMAAGLPLLTSDSGGILEYSKDGVTGFINHVDDVEGFVQSITKLYQNPKIRKKMGEYNKNVVKQYSVEKVNKIMQGVYESI